MLKIIGVILVLLGASSFGIGKAMQYCRGVRQLREFCTGVELLKCELNYSLLPLPRICEIMRDRLKGPPAEFFQNFGRLVEQGETKDRAVIKAIEDTKGLTLPNDALMALMDLCVNIGSYDLDGENRILHLSAQRIAVALERADAEKKPLTKSYATIGICTGIAIVILTI